MPGTLIVTARMDAASQARFDGERQRYFPASRNFLSAHVTLFHALPGEEHESILRTLETICRTQTLPRFETTGLRSLGRGVAYTLHMPEVVAVRANLAAAWRDYLSPQDQQSFRPHVTVQNKVQPAEAKSLFLALQAGYVQWQGTIPGLTLSRYANGPWTHLGEILFKQNI